MGGTCGMSALEVRGLAVSDPREESEQQRTTEEFEAGDGGVGYGTD